MKPTKSQKDISQRKIDLETRNFVRIILLGFIMLLFGFVASSYPSLSFISYFAYTTSAVILGIPFIKYFIEHFYNLDSIRFNIRRKVRLLEKAVEKVSLQSEEFSRKRKTQIKTHKILQLREAKIDNNEGINQSVEYTNIIQLYSIFIAQVKESAKLNKDLYYHIDALLIDVIELLKVSEDFPEEYQGFLDLRISLLRLKDVHLQLDDELKEFQDVLQRTLNSVLKMEVYLKKLVILKAMEVDRETELVALRAELLALETEVKELDAEEERRKTEIERLEVKAQVLASKVEY